MRILDIDDPTIVLDISLYEFSGVLVGCQAAGEYRQSDDAGPVMENATDLLIDPVRDALRPGAIVGAQL